MASVVFQLWRQLDATGEARIFGEGEGMPTPVCHRRDFVYVDDVVETVVRHFLDQRLTSRGSSTAAPESVGAFSTWRGQSSHVAASVRWCSSRFPMRSSVDTSRILTPISIGRGDGCPLPSTSLEDGVALYGDTLVNGPLEERRRRPT